MVNVVDVTCGKDKVILCHNDHTICVSSTSVGQHLAHGDNLGPCAGAARLSGVSSETAKAYMISPNPNKGIFKVFVEGENPKVEITVYNIYGQLVSASVQNDGEVHIVELDKTVAEGIYYVHVNAGGEETISKIIVIK
jgi:hypothetical protein